MRTDKVNFVLPTAAMDFIGSDVFWFFLQGSKPIDFHDKCAFHPFQALFLFPFVAISSAIFPIGG